MDEGDSFARSLETNTLTLLEMLDAGLLRSSHCFSCTVRLLRKFSEACSERCEYLARVIASPPRQLARSAGWISPDSDEFLRVPHNHLLTPGGKRRIVSRLVLSTADHTAHSAPAGPGATLNALSYSLDTPYEAAHRLDASRALTRPFPPHNAQLPPAIDYKEPYARWN